MTLAAPSPRRHQADNGPSDPVPIVETVTASGYRESLTFRSIGDDVTITAPPGDYTFDPDPDLGFPIDSIP